MKTRFPLYYKIMLWFFLNLALIVFLFFLPFWEPLRQGFDWRLAGGADERIDSVGTAYFQ